MTTVKQPVRQIPFIIRVIWFIVFGWEITGAWILIAWALNATILGLPLGLWMLNRVPQVLTLKATPGAWEIDLDSGRARYVDTKQHPWLIRLPYFILIGWWFSLLWAITGWLLCVSIIGLPIGVLMLNILPSVATLQRA